MNVIAMPPCQAACPIHMDVQGYVAAIARGDVQEADRIIRRTNPFPSVSGRICTRECEIVCRRGQSVDEPVAIRALKRFAADRRENSLQPEPKKPCYEERIAVVGSGPAGLTAAHDLALMGYRVTVFEAEDELGGMMTKGIPGYRLPLDVVRKEIEGILSLGIEVRTNQVLSRDFTLHDLRAQFQAVFLAMGSEKSICPDCSGLELPGVITALEFLKDISLGQTPDPGKRVVVIGGGHTAIDAARTCLRLGAEDVTLAYRRTIDEMPAGRGEAEEAREEGVMFQFLAAPVKFLGANRVEKMRCVRMDLDKSCGGKGKLVCVEDSQFDIQADTVILATGYGPRTETVPELFDSEDRRVEIKEGIGTTNMAGVFVGGDFLSGPSTVVQAIASGRRGADSIHRYLRGLAPAEIPDSVVLDDLDDRVAVLVPRAERLKMSVLPVKERINNFNEVEQGFTVNEARAEAERCLNCGLGAVVNYECASCLNCVLVCPYHVPKPGAERAEIDVSQCQACGICAGQCPAAAIDLGLEPRQKVREQLRDVLDKAAWEAPGEFTLQYICDFRRSTLPLTDPGRTAYRILRPGLGRMEVYDLLAPFEAGAREVQVVSCGDEACKFRDCLHRARINVDKAAKVLEEIGLDPGRLVLVQEQDFYSKLPRQGR